MQRARQAVSLGAVVLSIFMLACSPHNTSGLQCQDRPNKALPYVCELTSGQTFRGLSLGMNRAQVFRQLRQQGAVIAWSARLAIPANFSPLKKNLDETDWAVLSRSDMWMMRAKGEPCVGNRYPFIVFDDGKLKELNVYCQKIP